MNLIPNITYERVDIYGVFDYQLQSSMTEDSDAALCLLVSWKATVFGWATATLQKNIFKAKVKMKILLLFIHPHDTPNLSELIAFVDHKGYATTATIYSAHNCQAANGREKNTIQ